MAKKSYDEIENINDVDGPMSSTSIHGAVVTLSSVKKGRKAMFFGGLLADENSQIRLVGFQGMQQRKPNGTNHKNLEHVVKNRERMRRIYNTSLQPGRPWPYVHPGRS